MRTFILLIMIIMLVFLCTCADNSEQSEVPTASSESTPTSSQPSFDTSKPDTPVAATGEVVITFDYERISGSASNQYAVWIEDMDGSIIKTLYATRWTADEGYRTRPDSIALWVEKSNLASMLKSEVDAISSATPRTGTQTYSWDLTDTNGVTVSPGEYRFIIEGTLRSKNHVLYSGIITIGNAPVTVQADAEYHYEASDRYATLTSDSPENNMIGLVTASYTPGS